MLLKKIECQRNFKDMASFVSCTRKQFVSINDYNSNLAGVKCEMPQGSILGPLLFFIYIKSLHVAKSILHHFADDANLLNFNSL